MHSEKEDCVEGQGHSCLRLGRWHTPLGTRHLGFTAGRFTLTESKGLNARPATISETGLEVTTACHRQTQPPQCSATCAEGAGEGGDLERDPNTPPSRPRATVSLSFPRHNVISEPSRSPSSRAGTPGGGGHLPWPRGWDLRCPRSPQTRAFTVPGTRQRLPREQGHIRARPSRRPAWEARCAHRRPLISSSAS